MYEVERKIEIEKRERDSVTQLLREKGFIEKNSVLQNDFYIEAVESPFGGNDLKRYRQEGATFLYTEKIWREVDGEMVRKEIEREVLQEEYDREVKKYPDAVKIIKERKSFVGEYKARELSIDMDSVKFDHSPSERYFIEGEIMTHDKDEIKMLRSLIKEFLQNILGKSELVEAPGMFKMALKKL